MCNLYSLTKEQSAIRDWFRAPHDRTGNLPLIRGSFPISQRRSCASAPYVLVCQSDSGDFPQEAFLSEV